MAEYPNNSHSARERTDSTAPGKAEKKLEKVVTGAAKTRKKSEARKFVNIFVPEDGENVKSYIMMDVIIPGIKNAIADVISIVLFGDSGRIGGSRSKRDGRSRLTYWDDRRDDRREYGRPRAAAGFEYDDIIFETRGDAELVLDQLESAIANYGQPLWLDGYSVGKGHPDPGRLHLAASEDGSDQLKGGHSHVWIFDLQRLQGSGMRPVDAVRHGHRVLRVHERA